MKSMTASLRSDADTERFTAVLTTQRAAYRREGAPSLSRRHDDLKRFRAAMLAHRDDIENAIDRDFGGRARQETAMMEILGVVNGIDYLLKNLKRFMKPQRRRIDTQLLLGRNWVEYQPLGVVGVISPWNYPVNLSLMPVVTAIAAGNRVMLKPSKFTPATNAVIATMFSEVFPPEQVALTEGDGQAFSTMPFDHLVFTGSTAVGKSVMRAASENLVPVTLELGGKSPTIVARGHATEKTIERIVFGKLLSGGQTCIAPDYALVHEDDLDNFISGYDALVKRFYPEGPTSRDYTAIINEKQHDFLQQLLDDAAAHGATIIKVGERPEDAALLPHPWRQPLC
jgi:coniferyl-aldehyde dehydrogenase